MPYNYSATKNPTDKHPAGELRPSQLLFSYGVGAIVDLPYISAMVMGLEDWNINQSSEIGENRLLQAVQQEIGTQVTKLLSPPIADESDLAVFDENIGVPIAPFPRWMLCPKCRLLAPIELGLFQLRPDRFRPDRLQYGHINCRFGTPNRPPAVVPARFLMACEVGHMDDFAWSYFVHRGVSNCNGSLRLKELSPSGEAASIQVECDSCGSKRRMSDAFTAEGRTNLASCSGRRPHLREYEDNDCTAMARPISLGASNTWFPIILSVLAVPTSDSSKLELAIENYWPMLKEATSLEIIKFLKNTSSLPYLAEYSAADIWAVVEARQKKAANLGASDEQVSPSELKIPEWQVLTNPISVPSTRDFQATIVRAPVGYENFIKQVVLVERLREVQAFIGFTRIESPSNYTNVDEIPPDQRVALTRKPTAWVPAAEVRGEGLFIEFNELEISHWLQRPSVIKHNKAFKEAFGKWRLARKLDPTKGYPGLRYILLHSFSHALMRQLALDCGYTSASLRERIYSLEATDKNGPMAGILLYTAASDSEGTLGGLVGLGTSAELSEHVDKALEQMELCASDPLCAEHALRDTLHGAACHACLFMPETSCERGNKYLDRSVMVKTLHRNDLTFFVQ